MKWNVQNSLKSANALVVQNLHCISISNCQEFAAEIYAVIFLANSGNLLNHHKKSKSGMVSTGTAHLDTVTFPTLVTESTDIYQRA